MRALITSHVGYEPHPPETTRLALRLVLALTLGGGAISPPQSTIGNCGTDTDPFTYTLVTADNREAAIAFHQSSSMGWPRLQPPAVRMSP